MSIQQNVHVDQALHGHLLNVARARRFQANLPLHFWGVFSHAAYIVNNIPINILFRKSPYEVLISHSSDYNHLQAVGYVLCNINHPTSLIIVPKNVFSWLSLW